MNSRLLFLRCTALTALIWLTAATAHAQLDAPNHALPTNGATGVAQPVRVLWRPVAGAYRYELQLATDAAFENLAYETLTAAYEQQVSGLWEDTQYHWRVRGVLDNDSAGAWSTPWSFKTLATGAPKPTTPVDGASDVPAGGVRVAYTYPTLPPNGFEIQYGHTAALTDGLMLIRYATTGDLPSIPFDTTVYWRVRVAGGSTAGPGPWSRTSSFRTVAVPRTPLGTCTPLTPANGAAVSDPNVTLVWSGPSSADPSILYHVRISSDATMNEVSESFDEVEGMSLNISLPAGDNTWYWQVRAIDTSGRYIDGPWSQTFSLNTVEQVEPGLEAPALLLPPNRSHSRGISVMLSWDSVDVAESYEVEIGRDTTFASVDTTIATPGRSAYLAELVREATYIWRARALAEGGRNIGPWSRPFTFTTRTIAPTLPGTITLTSPPDETFGVDPIVPLRWEGASDASAYLIHVSDDSTFATGTREAGSFDPTSTIALEPNRRWWWRVRGINEAGIGTWSSIWTFTTSTSSVSTPTVVTGMTAAITPTPSSNVATIRATIAPNAEGRLTISDSRGTTLYEEPIRADASGEISRALPIESIAPGVYRCRIVSSSGQVVVAPLVIVR